MPGQILRLNDGYRSDLVRDKVEADQPFTSVVDTARHSRPKRFVVLLSLDGDRITYAALATRTGRVATGQERIRYDSIRELTPIGLSTIKNRIASRFRRHFTANLAFDGWLPVHTWKAVIDVLRQDTFNDHVLHDLDSQTSINLPSISPRQLRTLIEERDALGLALKIFDPNLLHLVPSVSSINTPRDPFLLVMQNADLPEDVAINHDASVLDGWLPKELPFLGGTTFERHGHTLTVANVNRTPIERVLGVDLLYFHAQYRSFIFVQYKRMRRDNKGQVYYRPIGDSYEREYQQMKTWSLRMSSGLQSSNLSSYRLGSDAFFFKVYANPLRFPISEGLLKGMYFPLSYWNLLVDSPEVRGPRGGVRITHGNAGRYLTNTQFADLVGSGWVGSSPKDEEMLADVLAEALQARHSVTLAIARGT